LAGVTTACLAVALVLASCSSAQDRSDSVSGNRGDEAAMSGDAEAPAVGGLDAAGPERVDVSLAQIDTGRSVVSSASLTVRTTEVEAVAAEAVSIADDAGGLLFAEEAVYGDRPDTVLTLKVPLDRFDTVLADLGDLGELIRRNVSTEDVTDQVVDLDGRIASAEASVLRLRELYQRAGSVAEVAVVEAELQQRESELETLRGQQRTLDAQIDRATIMLTVTSEDLPVPDEDEPGFTDGFEAGWDTLVAIARATAVAAGALLPFVPVALAFAVLIVALRRRARRRHPASSGSAGGEHPRSPLPQPPTTRSQSGTAQASALPDPPSPDSPAT
jgi:hypothetical protein